MQPSAADAKLEVADTQSHEAVLGKIIEVLAECVRHPCGAALPGAHLLPRAHCRTFRSSAGPHPLHHDGWRCGRANVHVATTIVQVQLQAHCGVIVCINQSIIANWYANYSRQPGWHNSPINNNFLTTQLFCARGIQFFFYRALIALCTNPNKRGQLAGYFAGSCPRASSRPACGWHCRVPRSRQSCCAAPPNRPSRTSYPSSRALRCLFLFAQLEQNISCERNMHTFVPGAFINNMLGPFMPVHRTPYRHIHALLQASGLCSHLHTGPRSPQCRRGQEIS